MATRVSLEYCTGDASQGFIQVFCQEGENAAIVKWGGGEGGEDNIVFLGYYTRFSMHPGFFWWLYMYLTMYMCAHAGVQCEMEIMYHLRHGA